MSYSSYSPRSPSSSHARGELDGLPMDTTPDHHSQAPLMASSYIKKDLGTLVQAFQLPSETVSPARITYAKPISSYTWIEAGSKPTILVPGIYMLKPETLG
ncbi:hypothetical protein FRC05_010769 [Tulasnella sp. 425]|nr:hypothetical protein FRC05_010769 [Tulasnella sp. 425]